MKSDAFNLILKSSYCDSMGWLYITFICFMGS